MDDSTTARPRVSTSVARSFTRARSSPRRSSRRRVASRRVAHCGRSHFFPIHRHTVTRRVAASLRDRRAARHARRRCSPSPCARASSRSARASARDIGTARGGRARARAEERARARRGRRREENAALVARDSRAREGTRVRDEAVEREDGGVDWSRDDRGGRGRGVRRRGVRYER